MVISRTPFRISFFCGGTDYPAWFVENGGAVLATTFDKYCYISCRILPPFFEHNYRVVYSKVETVKKICEIEHPSVRASLEFLGLKDRLEIHHDGDLPARTGLGSSSSFTVGMLHSLYALQGIMPSRLQLSNDAIHVERYLLNENVGSQDQILAANGGFSKIEFFGEKDFRISPITVPAERINNLNDHLMLFFTGVSRFATDIAKEKIKSIPKKKKELSVMMEMVQEGTSILSGEESIIKFGQLLHESWMIKRSLTEKISSSYIDNIYDVARGGGAIGGKLLGAGGGGFMLIFAKPEHQPTIREKLNKLHCVPFKFENKGSQIIVFQPDLNGSQ